MRRPTALWARLSPMPWRVADICTCTVRSAFGREWPTYLSPRASGRSRIPNRSSITPAGSAPPMSAMRTTMSRAGSRGRFTSWTACLVTDGGGAAVVVSADVARNAKKKPAWILGSGEGHDHQIISQMPDLTRTIAHETGPRAMQMAGVTHDDIDLTMIYDSFTYTVLTTLESLGYCGPGEAPDFVANLRTGPDGDFPMNTSGGRAFLRPHRHVWHVLAHRGDAAAARRRRRSAGSRTATSRWCTARAANCPPPQRWS